MAGWADRLASNEGRREPCINRHNRRHLPLPPPFRHYHQKLSTRSKRDVELKDIKVQVILYVLPFFRLSFRLSCPFSSLVPPPLPSLPFLLSSGSGVRRAFPSLPTRFRSLAPPTADSEGTACLFCLLRLPRARATAHWVCAPLSSSRRRDVAGQPGQLEPGQEGHGRACEKHAHP